MSRKEKKQPINDITRTIASGFEELAAASDELSSQAEILKKLVARLKVSYNGKTAFTEMLRICNITFIFHYFPVTLEKNDLFQ